MSTACSRIPPLRMGLAVLLTGLLTGCGASPKTIVNVAASSSRCTTSPNWFQPGATEFRAIWTGDTPGELYLFGLENGEYTKLLGEIEELTNGNPDSLTLTLAEGTYEVMCRPEDGSKGVRAPFTVSKERPNPNPDGDQSANPSTSPN